MTPDVMCMNAQGINIMLLGLDVRGVPDARAGKKLMEQYKEREHARGRKKLILTRFRIRLRCIRNLALKTMGSAILCGRRSLA